MGVSLEAHFFRIHRSLLLFTEDEHCKPLPDVPWVPFETHDAAIGGNSMSPPTTCQAYSHPSNRPYKYGAWTPAIVADGVQAPRTLNVRDASNNGITRHTVADMTPLIASLEIYSVGPEKRDFEGSESMSKRDRNCAVKPALTVPTLGDVLVLPLPPPSTCVSYVMQNGQTTGLCSGT